MEMGCIHSLALRLDKIRRRYAYKCSKFPGKVGLMPKSHGERNGLNLVALAQKVSASDDSNLPKPELRFNSETFLHSTCERPRPNTQQTRKSTNIPFGSVKQTIQTDTAVCSSITEPPMSLRKDDATVNLNTLGSTWRSGGVNRIDA
jgi:hypothetical protein